MSPINTKTVKESNDVELPPPSHGARTGRSTAYLVSVLAGGNVIAAMLRMLGGVVQMRAVPPPVLGLFSGIGLSLNYTRFLHIGVINGLTRELPYFIGKGDRARAEGLAAAAQAWSLAVGAVASVPLLGIGAYYFIQGDMQLAAGWATNALLAVLFFYASMYLPATFRTAHDFARLSLATVVQNAVSLVLVALAVVWGFYGLCLRALITALVAATILFAWRPLRIGPQWNFKHFKHLVLIGLPIFGVGELYGLWSTIDATLVFGWLGKDGMGLYSMVIVVGSTMDLLPQAVSQVVYPRMAEQYGRTHRIAGLMGIAIKPMLVTFAGMIPLVIAGWFLAGPLTRGIAPKYVGGIAAAQWALLPPLALAFAPIYTTYLVVNRMFLYAAAVVFGMAAYFVALLWLTRNGAELTAFPQAMLIGRIVYVVVGYILLVPIAADKR